MALTPEIVVLGSVHMDLIATADRLPGPGESVAGGSFTMAPGGKGGNQACQFALLGASTAIVTRLGDDDFGRRLMGTLASKGVDISLIAIDPENPTGASTVFAAQGDYASIIAPGAAARLSREDIARACAAIEGAHALILQLELPVETSLAAAEIARAAGVEVILNASPMPDTTPAALLNAATTVIVNRFEAQRLLGAVAGSDIGEAEVRALKSHLDTKILVVTCGDAGAWAVDEFQITRRPAFPAKVADTVGAGDAFLGAFVLARLRGGDLNHALKCGAAAGALAVRRTGAIDALPTNAEIEALLTDAARRSK